MSIYIFLISKQLDHSRLVVGMVIRIGCMYNIFITCVEHFAYPLIVKRILGMYQSGLKVEL